MPSSGSITPIMRLSTMEPVRTGIARSMGASVPPKTLPGPSSATMTNVMAATAIARIIGIASAAPRSASISENIAGYPAAIATTRMPRHSAPIARRRCRLSCPWIRALMPQKRYA